MLDNRQLPQQFKAQLTRMEELLRLHRIAARRKFAPAMAQKVRSKCEHIIGMLKVHECFSQMEEEIRQKMERSLAEPGKKEVSKPKKNSAPQPSFSNKPNSSNSSLSSKSDQSQSSQPGQPLKVSTAKSISSESSRSVESEKVKVEQQPQPREVLRKSSQPADKNITSLNQFASSGSGSNQSNGLVSLPTSSDEFGKLSSNNSRQPQKLRELKAGLDNISSIGHVKQGSSRASSIINDLESAEEAESNGFAKKEEKMETNKEIDESFEDSQRMSESSGLDTGLELIQNFCQQNKKTLTEQLLFNDDLFDYITEEDEEIYAYLFGVNKLGGRRNKLMGCTIMKFLKQQVVKNQETFEKEARDFTNNMRTPIGLIIKGQSPQQIKPEHIKFLTNIKSPYPIVMVTSEFKHCKGFLCTFDEILVESIKKSPNKKLDRFTDELNKKTLALPISEDDFLKEDRIVVISKFLNRVIPQMTEEAPNAITVSKNDCIRQEKLVFGYKVHTKFLVNTKPQYAIYYVNNNVVNSRVSYKDYDLFKRDTLEFEPKGPAIFSINVTRDTGVIKKEFFEMLLICNDKREPFFFVHLSNIGVKKTIIAALKKDVNKDTIATSEPLQFKFMQKDTKLTECLNIITKNNNKQFEAEGKEELVEVKVNK